ncbi:MAG: DUF1330 domain-containing protein [Spirochaetales bacterium]|nr:DUF1330 domain-containing protein [Spirochaetales bacterium]
MKKPVYFIANIRITDEDLYRKYLNSCSEIFSKYGGKYLSVDEDPEVLEGEWDYSRAVLIEFPDRAEFNRWYSSPEYKDILQYRLSAAQCDTILISQNS